MDKMKERKEKLTYQKVEQMKGMEVRPRPQEDQVPELHQTQSDRRFAEGSNACGLRTVRSSIVSSLDIGSSVTDVAARGSPLK